MHVEYLANELRRLVDVDVHCFGRDRVDARAHRPPTELTGANAALQTIGVDVEIAAATGACELVHSHTWYANLGGHLAKLLHGIPHVCTTHSLEPLRPWKREQLGGGYALSLWCERTALEGADIVIAVSNGMRADVMSTYPGVDPDKIRVIYNGIDTNEYAPDRGTDVLTRYGVDPDKPYVIFVGRVTRQKGLPHLLRAARDFVPEAQLLLLAGQADTPELAAEVNGLITELTETRQGVIVVEQMLSKPEVIQLLTHATVFVCPSVYEPLGIVNLEAMACTTAVVASRVGGIPEVVEEGRTGLLVEPGDEPGLATAVNSLLSDPDRAAHMGQTGRSSAVTRFSWRTIAEQTTALYRELVEG